MSLSESDNDPIAEAFEDADTDGTQEVTEPSASDAPGGEWFGLRNTEPPVSPADVGAQLDLHADWWQHLGAGFIKQSGSSGTEAWMHYVMAVILLGTEVFGDADESTPDRDGNETEREDTDDDTETFEGPVL